MRNMALSVLRKLADHDHDEISERDLLNKHWQGIKKAADAKNVLEYLVEMGWALMLQQPHKKGRGRHRSPVYRLHPNYREKIKTPIAEIAKIAKREHEGISAISAISATAPSVEYEVPPPSAFNKPPMVEMKPEDVGAMLEKLTCKGKMPASGKASKDPFYSAEVPWANEEGRARIRAMGSGFPDPATADFEEVSADEVI